MTDHIIIDGYDDCWRLAWYLVEEEEIGLIVGDSRIQKVPSDPDDWKVYMADLIAKRSEGVQRDCVGLYWKSRSGAAAALRAIKQQWKVGKRPLEDWEHKAIAAGWKPPKKVKV